MATRMQQRRGTAQQWTTSDPILNVAEIGYETDTNKFKIGDGTNHWSDLSYFTDAESISNLIDGAPALLNTLNELAAAVNDDPAFFTTVATNLSTHQSDTTQIHGIADTSVLVTNAILEAHRTDTTEVHGIPDTSVLVTQDGMEEYVGTAVGNATVTQSALAGTGIDWNSDTDQFDIDNTVATKTYADSAVSTHNSDTTMVHGIADTSALATTSDVSTAKSGAETTAAGYVTTHNDDTSNVHGIADTSILATTTGTQTLTNKTLNSPTIDSPTITSNNGAALIHGILLPNAHGVSFEGSTDDAFETILTVADPTADRTITLPDATGTVQLRVANVSDTEIGFLDGVTSSIQTQLGNLDTNKAPKNAPTFTGTVTSTNNLVVDGDFTVNGTNFSASATTITIEDNIVQLAHQNAGNTVDLGLVVAYNDGAAKHSGLVRDVSDDEWKLFKGVTTEPTTTVNFGQGSLDNLELNNLVAAGVVFTDGTQTKQGVPSLTPIVQKTASYTLSALTHRDSLIEVSSTSGTTVTIPVDSTIDYPIGTTIDILQTNTGQVTIAPVSGSVTVNATPGLKLRTRWSSATLMKRAANTWVVFGDLTA
jgi:hypothetical protein